MGVLKSSIDQYFKIKEELVNGYKRFQQPDAQNCLSLFIEFYTHHTMIAVCRQSQCCGISVIDLLKYVIRGPQIWPSQKF